MILPNIKKMLITCKKNNGIRMIKKIKN